jgi:hypothetical protein
MLSVCVRVRLHVHAFVHSCMPLLVFKLRGQYLRNCE